MGTTIKWQCPECGMVGNDTVDETKPIGQEIFRILSKHTIMADCIRDVEWSMERLGEERT